MDIDSLAVTYAKNMQPSTIESFVPDDRPYGLRYGQWTVQERVMKITKNLSSETDPIMEANIKPSLEENEIKEYEAHLRRD